MTLAKKIIIGLSGGVDSAVAALLLKEQGHDIEAVFMQNWTADQDDPYCSLEQDLRDARLVADKLNIALHTVNFSNAYWNLVFQNFLDEYAAGRTPNPDILCNKEIKFSAFLKYALSLGADCIATGHYANTRFEKGAYHLLKGRDNNKDQSYFLHTLNQDQLAKSRFPIGHLEKNQVRGLAKKAGFMNHNKKDSTGICFIGERKFTVFLKEYLLAKPGKIETLDGQVLGQHQGLMFYTLGQRQGLGIGGRAGKQAPWYVLEKDIKNNVLKIGQGHDHPALFRSELHCQSLHWINNTLPERPFSCKAKTRYRQQEQSCRITPVNEGRYQVVFAEPQRAITPGQSVVFYQEALCLGGGVID